MPLPRNPELDPYSYGSAEPIMAGIQVRHLQSIDISRAVGYTLLPASILRLGACHVDRRLLLAGDDW